MGFSAYDRNRLALQALIAFRNMEIYGCHNQIGIRVYSIVSGGNFDISSIFIDSLYKVAGSKDQAEAAEFLAWCEQFGERNGVNFTISVTEDPEAAIEGIKKYC